MRPVSTWSARSMSEMVSSGTGRSCSGWPSASSVSVTMPRRATVSYALRAPSRPPAILVASPKHTGSRPVANGSRLPVWPPFSARNRCRTRCSAWLELSPRGLSSRRMPSSLRKMVFDAMRSRDPRLVCLRDGMWVGRSRRPMLMRNHAVRMDRRRRTYRGLLGVVAGTFRQVAQQVLDALAAIDRVVVGEVQLRHVPQLDRARELVADLARQLLQALHHRSRAFWLQRRHEHLGVRHVAGDLDVGHARR